MVCKYKWPVDMLQSRGVANWLVGMSSYLLPCCLHEFYPFENQVVTKILSCKNFPIYSTYITFCPGKFNLQCGQQSN